MEHLDEVEEKGKQKAKVDMYTLSPFTFVVYALEGHLVSWECLHQSSPFTWQRLTLTLGLGFAS